MKCPRCAQCTSRPAVMFAFKDGKLVYSCRRHKDVIPKDMVCDWMRLGKWKEVATTNAD